MCVGVCVLVVELRVASGVLLLGAAAAGVLLLLLLLLRACVFCCAALSSTGARVVAVRCVYLLSKQAHHAWNAKGKGFFFVVCSCC